MKREALFTGDEKLAKRQKRQLSFWVPERKAMSAKYKCKECSEETYGAFASVSECENAVVALNERMDVLQEATRIPDVIRGLVGAYRNKKWELQEQLPLLYDTKRVTKAYIINATQYVVVLKKELNLISLTDDAKNYKNLQVARFSERVYDSALSEDGSLIALLFLWNENDLKVRIYGSENTQPVREYEFPEPTTEKSILRLNKMLFAGSSIIFEFSGPFKSLMHMVMDSTNGNVSTLRELKKNVSLSHVVKGVAYFSNKIDHATWSSSGVYFYSDPLEKKLTPKPFRPDFKVGSYYFSLYPNEILLYHVKIEGPASQVVSRLPFRDLWNINHKPKVTSLGDVIIDDSFISVHKNRLIKQHIRGIIVDISPDGTAMLVIRYDDDAHPCFQLWTKYT
jgi:hypothetical protein